MVVVHTVNQLEEAVRVGAEEILVTGMLANHVHEVSLLRACRDMVAVPGKSFLDGFSADEIGELDDVLATSGLHAMELSTLVMITGDYAMVDSQLDPKAPSLVLQRRARGTN